MVSVQTVPKNYTQTYMLIENRVEQLAAHTKLMPLRY